MNIEHGGVVSGAGAVGRHARVVAAVFGAGGGDRQERRPRCHFGGQDAELRGIQRVETVKMPLDIYGEVAFGHVAVELHRLAGKHGLVRLEGHDVRNDCDGY